MRTRAWRRHHRERMVKRALRLLPWVDTKEEAVRFADHMAVCSCAGCGNQRRMRGRTMQERRSDLDVR